MDSPLALGALRIARGAGGEGVDVNGSLVEREKGDEFGIETPASSSTIACGQQKVKRSEEHTSELQSRLHLVCRLLLEKKKKKKNKYILNMIEYIKSD